MAYPNGEEYEGNYINGVKSRNGVFIYKNSDKYVGDFRNNVREGYGKLYFADKSFYEV